MSNLSQFGCCNNIPASSIPVELLLVGGGGGGGRDSNIVPYSAAPGGAGGMVEGYNIFVEKGQTFPITIGGGGAISPGTGRGTPGGTSTFGYIYAGGGGGGGGSSPTSPTSSDPGIGGDINGSGGAGIAAVSPSTRSGRGGAAGGAQYSTFSNIYGKAQSLISFATPGDSGGAALGSGAKSNSISGTTLNYSGVGWSSPTLAYRGYAGTGAPGGSSAPGIGGAFVVRWPTAYPNATSVTGNVPVPGTAGFYTYAWVGSGSITF